MSALYALDHGVSVVICNGMQEKAVKSILTGRRLGTFFTESGAAQTAPVEILAENGTLNRMPWRERNSLSCSQLAQ